MKIDYDDFFTPSNIKEYEKAVEKRKEEKKKRQEKIIRLENFFLSLASFFAIIIIFITIFAKGESGYSSFSINAIVFFEAATFLSAFTSLSIYILTGMDF